MSTNLNFDVRDMQRRATQTLGAFAVDTLRNKKWITKSYTSNFPFTDDHATKQSQSKLFKIFLRETLKAIPILKDESNLRFSIKKPEVSSVSAKIFVTGVDSTRLIRYAAILNRHLANEGIQGLEVRVHSEIFYKAWDPIVGVSYSLELPYSYFRPNNLPGNPYKLFLILDEILKVFSTLSKYTTVVDNETSTLFPLYITQRISRLEYEAKMKEAEAERELAKVKTPSKKKVIPMGTNAGVTSSTLFYTGTTTTTATTIPNYGTGTGTTAATDIAWPNTTRR